MAELSAGTAIAKHDSESNETQKTILQRLGPGLITGAADDDPSGIATYSQIGAQFGFGMLWTMLFSFPLMAAMQEISARIGRITGAGIAENLRKYYPKPIVYVLVTLLCVANIFNLGADIAAMGAAAEMVFGGNTSAYVLAFGLLSIVLHVYVPYRQYVGYLKWLTVVLFTYIVTAFTIHVPWMSVIRATLIPSITWDSTYWMALVAVLGTTISPYLFFWQTSQEAEDVSLNENEKPLKRKPSQAFRQLRRIALDSRVGMGFSNLVAFFVILTTAATLYSSGGGKGIQTSADAAKALQPIAGHFAFLLFAFGIIGTGFLAIPVLAGSAAYAVGETFQWRSSLESKPQHAPKFYLFLTAATVGGIALNFFGLDPIRALFWSAVINGLVAVPVMIALMVMSANRAITGKFPLPVYLRIVGWSATAIMFLASLAFAGSLVRK
jgi:NRAMP (natural resistance-associated macrophage protein)-like metal ion transporter